MTRREQLERQLSFLERALEVLLRRWRNHLPFLGIFSLLVFVFGSLLLTTEGLRVLAVQTLDAGPHLVIQRVIGGRQVPIPQDHAASLRNHPAVRTVRGRSWGYYFDAARQAQYTLVGWDGRVPAPSPATGLVLTAGRLFLPGERDVALVGLGYARDEGLRPGDEVILLDVQGRPRRFELIGQFSAATDLWTHDLVVLPDAALRELLGLPETEVTDLVVELHEPGEQEAVANRIATALPDCRILTQAGLLRGYRSAFGWRSGVAGVVMALVLLSFGVLVWARTAGGTREEEREIGVLRALGWHVQEVLTLKLWEGTVLALLAYSLGMTAAYLHVRVFDAALLRPLLLGWSEALPRFALPPALDAETLLLLLFCSWGPYVCVTLIPAWRAAAVDPEQALRGG